MKDPEQLPRYKDDSQRYQNSRNFKWLCSSYVSQAFTTSKNLQAFHKNHFLVEKQISAEIRLTVSQFTQLNCLKLMAFNFLISSRTVTSQFSMFSPAFKMLNRLNAILLSSKSSNRNKDIKILSQNFVKISKLLFLAVI